MARGCWADGQLWPGCHCPCLICLAHSGVLQVELPKPAAQQKKAEGGAPSFSLPSFKVGGWGGWGAVGKPFLRGRCAAGLNGMKASRAVQRHLWRTAGSC